MVPLPIIRLCVTTKMVPLGVTSPPGATHEAHVPCHAAFVSTSIFSFNLATQKRDVTWLRLTIEASQHTQRPSPLSQWARGVITPGLVGEETPREDPQRRKGGSLTRLTLATTRHGAKACQIIENEAHEFFALPVGIVCSCSSHHVASMSPQVLGDNRLAPFDDPIQSLMVNGNLM